MPSPPRTIILITGANQGIGFEVAKQILATQENAYILLGARNAERGAKTAAELDPTGTSVEPITIDVSDDASIERAVEQVASRHGRLDVLINNAGINNEIELHLEQLKQQQQQQDSTAKDGATKAKKPNLAHMRQLYRAAYDVNVFGAALTTEAFTPLLAQAVALPPRIIFVSSHTGSLGLRIDESSTEFYSKMRNPSFPIYRSSKSALNMLTLHYAAKFADRNWKVNASCPNLTATNFSRGMGRPVEESAANIVRLAALGADGESGVYSDENGFVPW